MYVFNICEINDFEKKIVFTLMFEKRSYLNLLYPTQSAITCSKLTIETLEQGVRYVHS